MNRSALFTAPRHEPTSKRKKTASKTVGKDLVYISSHATSEQDIMESLLGILFRRSVYGYPWDRSELRARLGEADPRCVIISPPLGCEQNAMKSVWRIVRKIHPAVSMLWLSGDSNNTPLFLAGGDSSMRLLVTESFGGIVQKFVKHLAELTGIKPSIQFKK